MEAALLLLLLLLLALLLLPKENVVVFGCGGFWLAPNVNIPGAGWLSFVLTFAKTEAEAMVGVPKVDDDCCVPNGDGLLLLLLNAGGPFAVTVVPMPNVGFGEMTFWPTNVLLDGAGELK